MRQFGAPCALPSFEPTACSNVPQRICIRSRGAGKEAKEPIVEQQEDDRERLGDIASARRDDEGMIEMLEKRKKSIFAIGQRKGIREDLSDPGPTRINAPPHSESRCSAQEGALSGPWCPGGRPGRE